MLLQVQNDILEVQDTNYYFFLMVLIRSAQCKPEETNEILRENEFKEV